MSLRSSLDQSTAEGRRPCDGWLPTCATTMIDYHAVKHLHRHDPALGDKVIGVETVDHPSDGQVVA
jgi:hypothetical protein